MTLTARDKKLASLLIPVVVLVAYWFLVLSPQRAEVAKLDTKLTTAQSARDSAEANANQLSTSKTKYAADYATVVRLGKAIPSSLDMPSLLVQLDSAAKGTGIDFNSITVGTRTAAAAATTTGAAPAAGATPAAGSSGAAPPVAAGGEAAKSTPGKATEQANNASKTSDSTNQAAGATTTGTAGAAAASSSAPAGLDTVPLNFKFNGSYFDLADFFHRVKRFVRVANKDIRVRGRLMTIDGVSFKSASFPEVSAEVTATIYLSPKTQGTTAGGTSQGPATTPAAATPAATTSGAAPTPAAATSSGTPSQ